jgi:hypothetical protein
MSEEIKQAVDAANTEGQELIHCIYTSAENHDFTPAEVQAVLKVSRENNERLGVTGMLLYEAGSFFQVLEGEKDVVEKLFEAISRDKRHDKVLKLIVEPIESRSFSEWTMGYAGVSREELSSVNGLNDFFSCGKCYSDLDQGRAKLLLAAFKDGRWRKSII